MNSISKAAGMAGFLYFFYGVIHLSADASQQKLQELQDLNPAMNYSRPVFQGDPLGRSCG